MKTITSHRRFYPVPFARMFAVRKTVKAFATAVEQLPTGASVLAKLFALLASCGCIWAPGIVTALGASSNALQKHGIP